MRELQNSYWKIGQTLTDDYIEPRISARPRVQDSQTILLVQFRRAYSLLLVLSTPRASWCTRHVQFMLKLAPVEQFVHQKRLR